jgi:SAM-dependent methyltransferase
MREMNAFDALALRPDCALPPEALRRLGKRHRLVIDPFRDEIRGARLLDLGAHDGRWCYAFALAGAGEVLGVEPRADLAAGFARYPDDDARARVRLVEGEAVPALEALADGGERFDVVAVLGLFYHLIEHFRLLWLIRQLDPRLVIVDSEFSLARAPVIELARERTDKALNAVAQLGGQRRAIKGVPSLSAMEAMADALDYALHWIDPAPIAADPEGVRDYFRQRQVRRAVCALRPR